MALYRKYRSRSLDDVVGQNHITETLNNALKNKSYSHAYLFTGPRGVGKTSVARILAHEINGLNYGTEDNQLDIIEIDAASNRRIDEIRDLREKVYIAPTSAKYKVYIIDEVHMLTREAFNALLKTLEEPPEHAIFILATTELHKVPETIISRTQQFSFKPINVDEAVLHLRMIADKEKLDIDDSALKLIAEHGRGSFRDSISMLDQISSLSGTIDSDKVSKILGIPNGELLEELINSVVESNVDKLFETTTALREYGSSPSAVAKDLISKLRQRVISNKSSSNAKLVDLMKSLLPYTSTNSSYEAIEISLLDAVNFKEDSVSEVSRDITQNIKTEKVVEPEKIVLKTDKESGDSDVEIRQNSSSEDWSKVLNALKGKHNTLYGVLRMANAEIVGEKIILTFNFEFHKKQLNQNKHLESLNGVIIDTLGKKHELEIIVKKRKNNNLNSDKAKNISDITNVSNIFEGAELLES